jgi:hypothetical protein
MRQHALDNTVGAAAVLGNLAQIPCQHVDRFVELGAPAIVERGDCRRRRLLQLVEQLDREVGKIVDEIQEVLDLVGDPGGQLPKSSHLLRVEQARLRHLQIAQSRFGRVARGADLRFGALPLGHVAIDQYESTPRDRIVAHLDDAAIKTRALSRPWAADIFGVAPLFGLEIDRAELAALDEVADILGPARPPGQKRVGQVEQLLEIPVPGSKPQVCAEHRDAVAHIVEGDTQLGLSLAGLVEQARIVDRDDGLVSETLQQRDLLVGEWPHLLAVGRQRAEQYIIFEERRLRAPPISTRARRLGSPAR